jgi:hypothetical protein
MRYVDENDKDGRYSGDVNEDHQPHGSGKMKYKDGSIFEGVWAEGSMVHGKSKTKTKSSSSSKTSSSTKESKSTSEDKLSNDWARKDIPQAKSSSADTGSGVKTVRKMKWMDYYGDPGQYTGQVDSTNMPNGKGTMRYDHGLVQDGMWSRGQFMEGSDLHCAIEGASTVTEEVSNTVAKTREVPSSRSKTSGVGERSTKKSSSSGRGQDP